jgi:glutamate-1-semialdehyde 2,1-aminomutase
MTQEYSISQYNDANAVMEKLNKLAKSPMMPLKREAMKNYLNYFETKCQKSKALNIEAREVIPGGVQHNLAFNYPFPICIAKMDDAFMWDVDGNKYIDFLCAGGPTILGNNYKPVKEKVLEVINETGPVPGLFTEYELKLAKLINHHMPAVEMFRMLGSGTEADMAAIRIARTATGKDKIIKMGGAYHGWSDQLVYALHIPGTGAMEAIGIPRGCNKDTQEVPPGDIDALAKQLEKNDKKGGTACVLIEPVGPESGTRPIPFEYNKAARELCDQYGALLIFDEVVTGFRLGLKGAQGYFGVKPDLTVFGKCIAGGYPMAGGVGGKKEFMNYCAAGIESGKKRAYVGGTLSANPLSCCAGYWAIKEIERTDACVKAGRAGDRATKGLQEIIEKHNLPYVVYNQGSIVHLETSAVMLLDIMDPVALEEARPRKHLIEEMGCAYMAEGVITIGGSRLYTMLAHTDEIIDDAIQRLERVYKNSEAFK